jgi:putative FmdB family regulatory protein
MPLYEYECDDCGHRFEKIQKFSDPLIETCPACGGTVRKLLSSPAIQFKGSGWYITDYARAGKGDGEKPAAKSGEKGGDAAASGTSTDASSKSAESSGETKSDSKSTKSESPAPAASAAKSS